MGRQIKLNPEEVWMLRNDVFPKTLAEWASYLDVSVPVIIAARKCRAPYDKVTFSQEFVNQMMEKYGRLLNA